MCTLLYRACCPGDFAGDIWLLPIDLATSPQLVGWRLGCVFSHTHDDVIKWKYFPRYWPFVRGIHRSPVNSRQWRGALMVSLICVWINDWVRNHEAGDLRRHRGHYDVTVMQLSDRETNCNDVIWMAGYQVVVPIMSARLHAPMGRVSPHAIRVVFAIPYVWYQCTSIRNMRHVRQ